MDSRAAQAIREVVAGNDFRQACILWERYAADIRLMIENGTATAGTMERAGELVRSACLAAALFRAHAAEQIARERSARSYAASGNQG